MVSNEKRVRCNPQNVPRGDELVEVLHLAEMFPRCHPPLNIVFRSIVADSDPQSSSGGDTT